MAGGAVEHQERVFPERGGAEGVRGAEAGGDHRRGEEGDARGADGADGERDHEPGEVREAEGGGRGHLLPAGVPERGGVRPEAERGEQRGGAVLRRAGGDTVRDRGAVPVVLLERGAVDHDRRGQDAGEGVQGAAEGARGGDRGAAAGERDVDGVQGGVRGGGGGGRGVSAVLHEERGDGDRDRVPGVGADAEREERAGDPGGDGVQRVAGVPQLDDGVAEPEVEDVLAAAGGHGDRAGEGAAGGADAAVF